MIFDIPRHPQNSFWSQIKGTLKCILKCSKLPGYFCHRFVIASFLLCFLYKLLFGFLILLWVIALPLHWYLRFYSFKHGHRLVLFLYCVWYFVVCFCLVLNPFCQCLISLFSYFFDFVHFFRLLTLHFVFMLSLWQFRFFLTWFIFPSICIFWCLFLVFLW